MGLYLLVTGAVVTVPLALWATSILLSFRAGRRISRRILAAVSAVLTGVGALVVCMSSVIADFNDYPGFTCVQRRTPELEELRTAWYAPLDTDPTLVRPFLFHSHEYELFPVGMQCTEWPPGYQELAVTTHSHWIYTVLFYSLLMFALLQAIRVTRPGILDRRAAHPRPNP